MCVCVQVCSYVCIYTHIFEHIHVCANAGGDQRWTLRFASSSPSHLAL